MEVEVVHATLGPGFQEVVVISLCPFCLLVVDDSEAMASTMGW